MWILNEMLAVVSNDLASEAIYEVDQKGNDGQTLLHYLYILLHFLNNCGTTHRTVSTSCLVGLYHHQWYIFN